MAGGNAIRGKRVGAGPMGEAERGEAAPRVHISFCCSNGHETRPSFAEDRPGHPRAVGLPALRPAGRPRLGEPAAGAEDRALQDPPRLREGAPLRRGRRGHPRRGAADAARPRPHPVAVGVSCGRCRARWPTTPVDPAALAPEPAGGHQHPGHHRHAAPWWLDGQVGAERVGADHPPVAAGSHEVVADRGAEQLDDRSRSRRRRGASRARS